MITGKEPILEVLKLQNENIQYRWLCNYAIGVLLGTSERYEDLNLGIIKGMDYDNAMHINTLIAKLKQFKELPEYNTVVEKLRNNETTP